MTETPKKLVLVVEDDADQCAAMVKALQDAGFSPMSAPGVREAIFKLKNQKFCCIVLDMALGSESGSELIDVIRTRKELPNLATPILLVSANLSKETLQGVAGKVQGAMVKPVDMAAMVAQVAKLSI